jgi:hypothetical protein
MCVTRAVATWLQAIRLSSLPISDALDAAEAGHDRKFLTALYVLLLSRAPTTATTLSNPVGLGMSDVAPVHLQRTLAGYWSLSAS